jgi:hypothetical protein
MGVKRLVHLVQSIGLEKLHAETLSPPGACVEEWHLVEVKHLIEGVPSVGLQITGISR